jgi:hypothetical protein
MAQRVSGLTYDAGCGRAVALFGSVDGRPCKVYAEEKSTEDSSEFRSVHLQCVLPSGGLVMPSDLGCD